MYNKIFKNALFITAILSLGLSTSSVFASTFVTTYAAACDTQTQIDPAECHALLRVYDNLDGDNRGAANNANRGNMTNINSWEGVQVFNKHVKTLILKGNNITNIPSGIFQGLGNTSTLSLAENNITSLESGSFLGLSTLSSLNIYYTQLNTLEANNFLYLPTLNSLLIRYTPLTTIPNDLFQYIPTTRLINLNHNNIDNMESYAFRGLTNPQYINLSNNNINYIHTGTFNLLNLQNIQLQQNNLQKIGKGYFSGANNIEGLTLFDNQISSIESGALNHLSNLHQIQLQNNKLNTIKSTYFQGLINLGSLSLASNQIATIESGAFQGLPALDSISLQNNELTSIKKAYFDNMINLLDLYLFDNQITTIESGAFQGLNSLQSLQLHNNLLLTIKKGYFSGLTNLYELFLNDNTIAKVESGSFDSFSSLSQLKFNQNNICLSLLPQSIFTYLDSFDSPKTKYGWKTQQLQSCPIYGDTIITSPREICDDGNTTNGDGCSSTGQLELPPTIIATGPNGLVNTLTPSVFTTTDNNAMCKYHPTDIDFASMSGSFTQTGAIHTGTYAAIEGTNEFFVRCKGGLAMLTGSKITFIVDSIAPTVHNPINGQIYTSSQVISFQDDGSGIATATLDGNPIANNTNVSAIGSHILVVTDLAGHSTTISFAISIPHTTIPTTKTAPVKKKQGFSGGGGGASAYLYKDACPDGDFSPSYYDKLCGQKAEKQHSAAPEPAPTPTKKKTLTKEVFDTALHILRTQKKLSDSLIDKVRLTTYEKYGRTQTTKQAHGSAPLDDNKTLMSKLFDTVSLASNITRKDLARIAATIGMKYLGKTREQRRTDCGDFKDLTQITDNQEKYYVKLACQIGIMGLSNSTNTAKKTFNPTKKVTIGEFATVMSRLLYGNAYNGGHPFYVKHLAILQKNDIISADMQGLAFISRTKVRDSIIKILEK